MKEEVYIIGGGYSLTDFDFDKLEDEDTIAINKSMTYIPNLNYFITMDFTALHKINSIQNLNATKVFIANFTVPYLKEIDGRIVDTRFNLVYKLEEFDMIIKSYNIEGFGVQWNKFSHGMNSGYCALQLAILLGYKTINLLGIDLISDKGTHFHGGYGQTKEKFDIKLEQYYNYFYKSLLSLKELYSDINIYSCSDISRLNTILPYKKI